MKMMKLGFKFHGNNSQSMSLFETSTNLFDNEKALRDEWVPNELPEREQELEKIASAFNPAVRSDERPHNVFIYGKSGQGKTVAVDYVLRELGETFEDTDKKLTVVKTTLQGTNTSYQAVGKILTQLEEGTNAPPKGHSYDDLTYRMFDELDDLGGYVVLVLDEIDNLGTDDDLLYDLPRAPSNGRLDNADVSVVGISNDFKFRENLSAKVKGTLGEVDVRFNPYNANELRTILKQRKEIAFQDDAVEHDVVPLCAAHAAKDEGAARQAIKLLYRAGDIACNHEATAVTTDHVNEAKEQLNREFIHDGLDGLTTQERASVLSIASLELQGETPARTKDVFPVYDQIVEHAGVEPLAHRSVHDKLTSLDTYNMVTGHEKSGGIRGGTYFTFELGDVEADELIEVFANADYRLSETAAELPLDEHQSKLS